MEHLTIKGIKLPERSEPEKLEKELASSMDLFLYGFIEISSLVLNHCTDPLKFIFYKF